MLGYRHGYHAGNHADVLKHTIQLLLIYYLSIKDTPLSIIDTHAGAGTYRLGGGFAVKNREFEAGISKLFNADGIQSAALNRYLNSVRDCNTNDKLTIYPGSPLLSFANLRDQDKLRLFELHSREYDTLSAQIPASDKRVKTIRDN